MPNQPVFGTLYTLDRFVYRQNSTLLYCTIKEIVILKIACFGVIYVPFSRVITRYNVYFFTRVPSTTSGYQLALTFHNTKATVAAQYGFAKSKSGNVRSRCVVGLSAHTLICIHLVAYVATICDNRPHSLSHGYKSRYGLIPYCNKTLRSGYAQLVVM